MVAGFLFSPSPLSKGIDRQVVLAYRDNVKKLATKTLKWSGFQTGDTRTVFRIRQKAATQVTEERLFERGLALDLLAYGPAGLAGMSSDPSPIWWNLGNNHLLVA